MNETLKVDKWIDEWLRFDPEVLGLDWHNQNLLTKLKVVCDVFVLFYMSSKFIVIVDILGCNFIVFDLILHINICTTAFGG